jgi:hypothetical protein
MQDETPIPEVSPNAPISAQATNVVIDGLNDLQAAFADNFRLPPSPATKQRPPVVRFHVSALPTGSPTIPYAWCRAWDGTNELTGDVAIRLTAPHIVGDELNAYSPAYGTDAGLDSNNNPIIWYEVGSGNGFPVLLEKTGGAQATSVGGTDYPPTWRYTIKDLMGKILALDCRLYTIGDPVERSPAETGWAVIAPNLTMVDNGTTPDGSAPTPYRLWHADEPLITDEECVPFSDSSSSSGGI